MLFFSSLIALFRKLLAPFPHLPPTLLKPFVPFLSWYIFLRGLFKIISGFQNISWGFRYNSLPEVFVSLMDINPAFFIIGGVMSILAGTLYLKAFPALAQPSRRRQGVGQWMMAAAVLTLVHLYETLFLAHSFFWLIVGSLVGWYFIFEFERAIGPTKVNEAIRPRKKA